MSLAKIMIVDDDPDAVKVLTNILEGEGYDVITAYTGQRALERLRGEKPALVLLDLMMPDMNGYEVCGEIKKDPKTASIPVIILTANDTGDTLQEALNKKADWYIGKPYDKTRIVSKVAQLLAGNKPNSQQ